MIQEIYTFQHSTPSLRNRLQKAAMKLFEYVKRTQFRETRVWHFTLALSRFIDAHPRRISPRALKAWKKKFLEAE